MVKIITGDSYEVELSGNFKSNRKLTWFICNYDHSENNHIVIVPAEYGDKQIMAIFDREFLQYQYPMFKSVSKNEYYFLINNAKVETIAGILSQY